MDKLSDRATGTSSTGGIKHTKHVKPKYNYHRYKE